MYFDDVDILTSRPEGMPYEEYKGRMRAQKKIIKMYLKGELIHLSKLYPHPKVLKRFGLPTDRPLTPADIIQAAQQDGNQDAILLLRGHTYERSDKE